MELWGWLDTTDVNNEDEDGEWKQVTIVLGESTKGLHVIGSCGECYFWNENPEDISLNGNTMGKCMRTDRWEEKIYGCIHWEKKEVAVDKV